jgi:hypothetical protein
LAFLERERKRGKMRTREKGSVIQLRGEGYSVFCIMIVYDEVYFKQSCMMLIMSVSI